MPEPPAPDEPGRGLDLPAAGAGSPASLGARLLAYLVDAGACALIAALFVPRPDDPRRGLVTLAVFVLEYLLLVSTSGQTLGMRLARVRVVRPGARDQPPGFRPTAVRTALLVLLVPVLLVDRYGRGLHDRIAGTVAVRT